jgi:hypothetical protein
MGVLNANVSDLSRKAGSQAVFDSTPMSTGGILIDDPAPAEARG